MTLNEAVRTILSDQPDKTASIELIADEINSRGLFIRRDKKPLPPYQVMMRAKLSQGKYSNLLEWIEPSSVKLKV